MFFFVRTLHVALAHMHCAAVEKNIVSMVTDIMVAMVTAPSMHACIGILIHSRTLILLIITNSSTFYLEHVL